MKYGLCVVLCVTLSTVAVVYSAGLWGDSTAGRAAGAAADEKEGEKPAGPPPLVIDKNPPRLSDGPPEKDPWDVPAGPVADNTACYCCHANYEKEPLAQEHAKANVGCVKCHGASHKHRNDENNVTPPDTMFPPEKIDPGCRQCHKTHDVAATLVIKRWQERCGTKAKPKEIVCTDCHGEHRLKSRSVRWDKSTGKLIIPGKEQGAGKAAESTKTKAPPANKTPKQP